MNTKEFTREIEKLPITTADLPKVREIIKAAAPAICEKLASKGLVISKGSGSGNMAYIYIQPATFTGAHRDKAWGQVMADGRTGRIDFQTRQGKWGRTLGPRLAVKLLAELNRAIDRID